jgi:hypothetical protein
MKNILFILLLTPVLCLAKKDPCSKIIREQVQDKTVCKSPELKHITIIKQPGADSVFVALIHFTVESARFDEKGLSVEFEDGTLVQDSIAKIYCQQENAVVMAANGNTMANNGKYLLQGFLKINADNIAAFSSKKIVSVRLSNISRKVSSKEALKVMIYVNCLKHVLG